MSALWQFVEVDQFGICLLCPTLWSWIEFVREDAHGSWNGDPFRIEVTAFSPELPIETRAGDCCVRQPGNCDVVQNVIASQALSLSREHARDQRIAARVMIQEVSRKADWGIGDSIERLRAQPHLEPVTDSFLIHKLHTLVSNLFIRGEI